MELKITEVSEIEIKAFSVEDIKKANTVSSFDTHSLQEKLEMLNCTPANFCWKNDAIGLGDAFERAMNELFNGKGEIALIVERRVLTLHE